MQEWLRVSDFKLDLLPRQRCETLNSNLWIRRRCHIPHSYRSKIPRARFLQGCCCSVPQYGEHDEDRYCCLEPCTQHRQWEGGDEHSAPLKVKYQRLQHELQAWISKAPVQETWSAVSEKFLLNKHFCTIITEKVIKVRYFCDIS